MLFLSVRVSQTLVRIFVKRPVKPAFQPVFLMKDLLMFVTTDLMKGFKENALNAGKTGG